MTVREVAMSLPRKRLSSSRRFRPLWSLSRRVIEAPRPHRWTRDERRPAQSSRKFNQLLQARQRSRNLLWKPQPKGKRRRRRQLNPSLTSNRRTRGRDQLRRVSNWSKISRPRKFKSWTVQLRWHNKCSLSLARPNRQSLSRSRGSPPPPTRDSDSADISLPEQSDNNPFWSRSIFGHFNFFNPQPKINNRLDFN